MSQARAKSFQMVKSLSYVCNKVCRSTITARSYCSNSSFKALSFVKKFSTLNSAAIQESFDFQNPNDFPTNNKNSSGYDIDFSFSESNMADHGLHRQSQYNAQGSYGGNASTNQQSNVAGYQISNRSYSSKVNSQVSNYSQPTRKSDEAGKERQLLEELDSFCKDQKLNEAVKILDLLEQHNVSVDIPRYLLLMNECGKSEALQEAKHVHDHLTRSVHHLDVYIHNKLMEMYLKCGSTEDAYELFYTMPHRNLTSWDMMITWLAKNGHGEDAIEMFTEFKRFGSKPDNQMFHGVFAACSVVGDMKEGLLHFESMIKTYNLVPCMDNYASVVDMLGSSGYLNEALEFIEKMPIKPSVEIWEIMMNQSRVHGNLELGDRCAELVDLLDPYRLDEQTKEGLIPIKPSCIAKEKEKEKEKKKSSDLNIYEFRARDTSHPDHEKLYSQLWCLAQTMKEVGYVPNTQLFLFHDVDPETKEEALLANSERLALSRALLTSPARAPIRIIRNLRLSADGHNALKIISKLVGRLIITSDKKRFHHIDHGVCSCGDYW